METTKYLMDFPNDLHKALKLRSVEEGLSMKDLIIKAVTNYLEQTKGGKTNGEN